MVTLFCRPIYQNEDSEEGYHHRWKERFLFPLVKIAPHPHPPLSRQCLALIAHGGRKTLLATVRSLSERKPSNSSPPPLPHHKHTSRTADVELNLLRPFLYIFTPLSNMCNIQDNIFHDCTHKIVK